MTPRMTFNFHLSVIYIFFCSLYRWCVGRGATFLNDAHFSPKDILALFANQQQQQQNFSFSTFFMQSTMLANETCTYARKNTNIRKYRKREWHNNTYVVCRWKLPLRQVGINFLLSVGSSKLNNRFTTVCSHTKIMRDILKIIYIRIKWKPKPGNSFFSSIIKRI